MEPKYTSHRIITSCSQHEFDRLDREKAQGNDKNEKEQNMTKSVVSLQVS